MLSYRIKQARINKGWNQSQLADKLNKSRTAIVNWETGYAKPESSTVSEIAALLDVDRDWLVDTSNDDFEKIEVSIDRIEDEREMTNSEKIGVRLRYYRKRKGFSGGQVAEILSVGRSTVSGYESGNREPNFDTLLMMAKLYDMSIDHLLGNVKIVDNNLYNIESEPWLFEILAADEDKKMAIKKVWEVIKKL